MGGEGHAGGVRAALAGAATLSIEAAAGHTLVALQQDVLQCAMRRALNIDEAELLVKGAALRGA